VPDFAEFYERDRGHHNSACRQVDREPDGRALPKLHDMQQFDQRRRAASGGSFFYDREPFDRLIVSKSHSPHDKNLTAEVKLQLNPHLCAFAR